MEALGDHLAEDDGGTTTAGLAAAIASVNTAAATTRSTRAWITGWDNGTETLRETDTAWPDPGEPLGLQGEDPSPYLYYKLNTCTLSNRAMQPGQPAFEEQP